MVFSGDISSKGTSNVSRILCCGKLAAPKKNTVDFFKTLKFIIKDLFVSASLFSHSHNLYTRDLFIIICVPEDY